tara:strand:+ start:811 stop:1098 length:288 start_codon:yes stop_codon:yes gene_type:complete
MNQTETSTQTTSPTVGAPDRNPAKQLVQWVARCETTTTVTRADQLRLGDTFPLQDWRGGFKNTTVESLAFEGEDVLINGTLSTSPGNCFQVLGNA